jgi:hypothetical protein
MRNPAIFFLVIWLLTIAVLIALSPQITRLFHPSSISPLPSPNDSLPPLPEKFFPTARMEFTQLPSGIQSVLDLKTIEGELAHLERTVDESYQATTSFRATVPRPAASLEDLEAVCPDLGKLWPELALSLPSATASPFYHSLYERKVKFIQIRLKNFRNYPTRHNFFDCQTILELTHPKTKQPVLLVQADMDVVTDGSDGDRVSNLEEIDNTSVHYQPFTAYNWPKLTQQPNPLIPVYQKQLDDVLDKLEASNESEEKKMPLYERRNRLRKIIESLKYRSTLVAHIDPFIVLPGFMFKGGTPHTPKMGDYVVVIHEGKAYPAVIGDSGPYSKIGEASLLLARTLNPQSNGNQRAVSKPSVTYLIFPGSRDLPMRQPDLEKWHQRCSDLIENIGGLSIPLYDWKVSEIPSSAAGD